jgi:hypothetical protein
MSVLFFTQSWFGREYVQSTLIFTYTGVLILATSLLLLKLRLKKVNLKGAQA